MFPDCKGSQASPSLTYLLNPLHPNSALEGASKMAQASPAVGQNFSDSCLCYSPHSYPGRWFSAVPGL